MFIIHVFVTGNNSVKKEMRQFSYLDKLLVLVARFSDLVSVCVEEFLTVDGLLGVLKLH